LSSPVSSKKIPKEYFPRTLPFLLEPERYEKCSNKEGKKAKRNPTKRSTEEAKKT